MYSVLSIVDVEREKVIVINMTSLVMPNDMS